MVNGVSKSYSMTGWRIGYTASNEQIAKVMSNMQSHATSNPNSIAQKAALAALEGPQEIIDTMAAEFVKRRDYMVDRINSIEGLSCIKPNGAFYVMMNISKIIGKELGGVVIKGSTASRMYFGKSKRCISSRFRLWNRHSRKAFLCNIYGEYHGRVK